MTPVRDIPRETCQEQLSPIVAAAAIHALFHRSSTLAAMLPESIEAFPDRCYPRPLVTPCRIGALAAAD